MHATVSPAYTAQSSFAVCPMRGVSLESFIGPGISAR